MCLNAQQATQPSLADCLNRARGEGESKSRQSLASATPHILLEKLRFAPRIFEITVVIASSRQVVSTRARHKIVETLSAHAPARSSKLVAVFVTSSSHLRPLVAAFPACHFLELRHHRNNGGTMRQKKCILVGAPNCEKSDASSRPLRLRASVPSRSPPQFTAQLIIMR